jgi:hypothetical protein
MKKILFTLAAAACFCMPAKAADWNGPVKQIISCSDTWFEVEIKDKTMSYGGTQKIIRFMVKADIVGAEKYKQMYAMSLAALGTRAQIWIGTLEGGTTTSVAGGNCNANNVPAQNAGGMAMYR